MIEPIEIKSFIPMPNSAQIQVIFESVDALVEVAIKEDFNTSDYLSHIIAPRMQVTPELLSQHLTSRDLTDAIRSLGAGQVKTALEAFKEAFDEQQLPSAEVLAVLEQHPNYNPLNTIDLRVFIEKLKETPIKPQARSRFLTLREISLGVAEPVHALRHLYCPFGFRKYSSPLNLNHIGPAIGIDEINDILKNYLEFHEYYWGKLGLGQQASHAHTIKTLKKEKGDLEKEKAALAKQLEDKSIALDGEKFKAEFLFHSLTNTDKTNAILVAQNKKLKAKVEALEQDHPAPEPFVQHQELIKLRKELAKAKASQKAILFTQSKTTSLTDILYRMATSIKHFFSWYSKQPATVLPTAKQTEKFLNLIYANKSKAILKFLKKHERLNISAMRNYVGESPLHMAASADLPDDVLQALLDRTDDINLLCNGKTPLMSTIGSFNIAQNAAVFLLNKGADPNIQDNFGYTLLHEAVRKNLPDIVLLLLQHGVNPKLKVHKGVNAGKTALDIAKENNLETIILIFDIYYPELNPDTQYIQGLATQPLIFNHQAAGNNPAQPTLEAQNSFERTGPRH